MHGEIMARPISRHLAPLVEQLELERPQIVTLQQLDAMMRALSLAGTPRRAAFRLRQHGWLLTTGVNGVFEFAPAERAGPISDGDPLLGVRAVLTDSPDMPVAAALGTALALLNITDRAPDVPELAMSKQQKYVPRPLRGRQFRTVRFDWTLPAPKIRGVPVHQAATVLVHLAHRPGDVRSWAAILEALPDIIAAAPVAQIARELHGRPHSTQVRLAYLTQGVAPMLASTLGIKPKNTVWFGRRGAILRYDSKWNIADTILPFAPIAIIPETNRVAIASTEIIKLDTDDR